MNTLPYKFICDSCGGTSAHYRLCGSCSIPMTMYSGRARKAHPVTYV